MRIDKKNSFELIDMARRGDKACRERLAEEARVRLRGYVLRLTMEEDLAGDIVQDSILEMFKEFGELKNVESFWPWLYRIALNKVRSYYGRKWRHKTVSLSAAGCDIRAEDGPDGLAAVITAEWKQIVLKSMKQLEPRHRAVLSMRCYDQMEFNQIANIMGCSRLGVRALFYRAKKALVGKLSSNGLGRGSLLAGLILFGKMTATSKAAVANVCVTSATLRVGALAAAAGIATTKTTILSLSAAAVVAVGGTVALAPKGDAAASACPVSEAKGADVLPATVKTDDSVLECWYFFPEGPHGPVITRGVRLDNHDAPMYCQWLQNGRANYFFNNRRNTLFIKNCPVLAPDLSVWRLPTDSTQMSKFLAQMENDVDRKGVCVVGRDSSLLTITRNGPEKSVDLIQVVKHRNLLSEDYFKFDWPAGIEIVDNRDDMHKRGWTYFYIEGHIAGRHAKGAGRMPLVYAASQQHYPWLRLQIGELEISDAIGGLLFKGLGRPWTGLHTVDVIRRDAARHYISSSTELLPEETKAKIILTEGQSSLTYIVDLEKDIVDRIILSGDVAGELKFSYLEDVDGAGGN
ncbi:MAG TPA: sigma-70 family RNA polymerase sigma factor, partial [Planctomycetes bacterium]|nr:sigma-70 family RNA polymerase sigma factor [Planctomycetota bacterium]